MKYMRATTDVQTRNDHPFKRKISADKGVYLSPSFWGVFRSMDTPTLSSGEGEITDLVVTVCYICFALAVGPPHTGAFTKQEKRGTIAM